LEVHTVYGEIDKNVLTETKSMPHNTITPIGWMNGMESRGV